MMSEGRFRGLTRGNSRALEALAVEPLEDNQVTAAYRITAPQWVHELLQAQHGKSKARAIGEFLAEELKESVKK